MSEESLLAKDEGGFRQSNPPEETYTAVCVDVIDWGEREKMYKEGLRKEHRVGLVFQLDATDPESGKRYEVTQGFNLSLNEKSNLSVFLEGWRGKRFTDDERAGGWNIMKLIGANGLAQIVHNKGTDGKVYANIKPMMKLPKGMPWMEAKDYVRFKDREKKEDRGAGPAKSQAKPVDHPEQPQESPEESPDDLPF